VTARVRARLSGLCGLCGPLSRWWYGPVPLARVAALRGIVYLFVPLDIVLLTDSALAHAYLPTDLYRPVLLARLLHIPAPEPVAMQTLRAVLVIASIVAATGRLPRLAGWVVAAGYLPWVMISMSYGKVDHDHLPLVVALLVLPTIGRARFTDKGYCEASGWAIRCVQIAAVCTYFLAAWAKMRWGGWGWANGETLQWALTRRRTPMGGLIINQRWLLHTCQWATLVAEFAAPILLFVRGRALLFGLVFFLGFHVATVALLSIHFLPHVICLIGAFAPLERAVARLRRGHSVRAVPAEPPVPERDNAHV
jgi:hypothetical protein